MKPNSRSRNMSLLQEVRGEPCAVCFREGPSDPHHIKTRGAGGPDRPWNLIAVCREHHSQIHNEGILSLWEKFPFFRARLKRMGWELVNGKLWNKKTNPAFDEDEYER